MGDRIQASEGVGLHIPERKSDCSGWRPSWYPFQIQVDACDVDGPDPIPLTTREREIPETQSIPWDT